MDYSFSLLENHIKQPSKSNGGQQVVSVSTSSEPQRSESFGDKFDCPFHSLETSADELELLPISPLLNSPIDDPKNQPESISLLQQRGNKCGHNNLTLADDHERFGTGGH